MTTTTLTVSGPEGDREIPLSPKGVLIGRVPSCDVVLHSDRVTRNHARIFQDPFDRWIIEDLKSRNGVWIDDQKVEAHAILPGEKIVISPFTLWLNVPLEKRIAPDVSAHSTTAILSDAPVTQIIRGRSNEGAYLSRARLKSLNAMTDRLSALTSPSRLYAEACRMLARAPGTVAIVLRLSSTSGSLPEVVASHFGTVTVAPGPQDVSNLHLSRRVLESVRAEGTAVMAGGPDLSQHHVSLTVVDQERPRTVLCAPIGETKGTFDALYMDVPADQAVGDMFDFVQAAARQVSLARNNLMLLEARTERQLLDQQLALARDIQIKLMPLRLPSLPELDVAVYYQPALWVGGDYCDVWSMPDGRLAFAVGDVAGKGLPAAMVMANLQAALRNTLAFCSAPSEAIRHIDRFLEGTLPEKMFVTLFLGLFSPSDNKLEYVNAGHIQPLIVRPRTGAQALGQPSNLPLGLGSLKDASFFKAETEIVEPSSALLVVTDGIVEALSPKGEQFGTDRLRKLFEGAEISSADEMVGWVTRAANDFREYLPQQDDVTVLALVNRA